MRKSIAGILLVAFVALSLCACGDNEVESSSSAAASVESGVVTSETTTISSEMEESSSESENSSSKDESNSSRPQVNVSRPNRSDKESSEDTSSVTYSESAVSYGKADLQIGAYHFSPQWTTNYGDDGKKNLEEFEDVVKMGYFNTFATKWGNLVNSEVWKICEEYDLTVWMDTHKFDSSKETIEEYLEDVDKYVGIIADNPEWWARFNGFHFDEPIWNGQSNADFLTMTQALYRKYGKRIFPVFATGEFTDYEGNQLQINMNGKDMKKINPMALKYVTDVGFDSYGVDVREGATNGNKYEDWQKVSANIVDGESYYVEHTNALLSLFSHNVNVWYFPCAYTTSVWGGLGGITRADEQYCLSHLNFFDSLLKKQTYQGGLFLYTYTQFSNANELGMQSYLVVTGADGKQKLRAGEPKWTQYSARLIELTKEYKKTEVKVIKGFE